jgi:hypothetical protein
MDSTDEHFRLYWFAIAADSFCQLPTQVRVREMNMLTAMCRAQDEDCCPVCWYNRDCERAWVYHQVAPVGAMRLVGEGGGEGGGGGGGRGGVSEVR